MPNIYPRMNRDQHAIRTRIIVRGTLVLHTPTHLGNGDSEGPTDMALQRDSISRQALLMGSSIAGALRNYVLIREHGFFQEEPAAPQQESKGSAELLFGGLKGADEGSQSPLIICDSLSEEDNPLSELRDGVRIDSQTRTPAAQAKYDLEMLAAGTHFPLQFELNIPAMASDEKEAQMCRVLAMALDGLACGDIGIGMKKRRGFGGCSVVQWKAWKFDLRDPRQLLQWLAFERAEPDYRDYLVPPRAPHEILGAPYGKDARNIATLEATFSLRDSLLIRAGQDEGVFGPDVRHLHARQKDGSSRPVIAGTSLAGILRHRAERIVNTLGGDGTGYVRQLFGDAKGVAGASRFIVHESVVNEARTDLIQNRIAIDRFTGGALDGALFNEQPIFAKPETRTTLRIEIQNPDNHEIGLLLLLLKDLWTGDLPIGGESSIGRGRLRGEEATVTHNRETLAIFKRVGEDDVVLEQGERDTLNALVTTLRDMLIQGANHADH